MLNTYIQSLSLILLMVLVGCAHKEKDYDYMSSSTYQQKPQLRQSLVSATEPLNESAVQKILSSKVVFPKNMTLAIVRLSDSTEGLDFQVIDKEIAEKFYSKTNWGSRIQAIVPVPQVMISTPVTLSGLRQTAVLLQADALLIIKPVSYSDWKFQWLIEDDKAKGTTSLEVLLLDTRTSVVPYTSLVTETVEVTREKTDYSNYELMSRAKKVSEAKALLQVAPAVQKFMTKAM